jgi:type II secretory pathway pseudopilin PulG
MSKRNWTRPWLTVMQGAITGVALGGCTASLDEPETVAQTQDHLYLVGYTWPSSMVNICIDPSDPGTAAQISKVKHLLDASWSKYTALQFKGSSSTGGGQATWGTCYYGAFEEGNYSTVALHFCNGSSTSAFCLRKLKGTNKLEDYIGGQQQPGYYIGVTENNSGAAKPFGYVPPKMTTLPYDVVYTPGFVHVGVLGDDLTGSAYDQFHTAFRMQVIHEFGHALGFAHDQDRPDNNGRCTNTVFKGDPAATTPYNYRGDFDNNSIMSYCHFDPVGQSDYPVQLSGTDVWAARDVYGKRPSSHGFMIQSDGNYSLAVNADGGARPDGMLKLTSACTNQNPDCTWTYQRGMLVSDSDPRLAIMRVQDPPGTGPYFLKLKPAAIRDDPPGTYACTPANPECTWTYRHGEFLLDADAQAWALNARGGAVDGNWVGLSPSCDTTNNSCMWTLPDVMLTSDRDPTLPVNAYGGAVNGNALKVNEACDTTNGSCTFRFHRGLIQATGNTSLALRAVIPTDGSTVAPVKLDSSCRDTINSCTWQWTYGRIQTDEHYQGRFYFNAYYGALNLNDVKLNKGCDVNNPDCVFSGLSAKN